MPWNIRTVIGGQMPSVAPMARGGYRRVSVPNPNSGSETYARNQQPSAQVTSGPLLPPNVGSSDPLGIGLQQRGLAMQREEDAAHAQNAASRGVAVVNTVAADPKWSGLLQALFESGAGRVRTGQAGRMGGPGFFETQGENTLGQRAQLLDYLKQQDVMHLMDAMRGR